MNRREFLKTSALVAGVLPFGTGAFGENAGSAAQRKFVLSAPLTHSDWMLKNGIAWGPDGVRHMLDACKEFGFKKIHWRALDGGEAMYRSKLVREGDKWDTDSYWSPQSEADKALFHRYNPNMTEEQRVALLKKFDPMDYSRFDSLAEAVRYGHKIGLEIHAWVSINEDDHAWGLQSDFSKKHPELRWRGRKGKAYHSQLSFAFPEVQRYKLGILKELLSNYDLDGLFLDWIRTGDVRDNPQNDADGVADYGYEKPLVEKFRKKFHKDAETIANGDEDWVRLRAEPQTEFMRDIRRLVHRQKRKVPVVVLVGHPWHYRGEINKIDGNLRGLLLDVKGWAHEGLVDAVVGAGYYRDGGNAEMAARALQKETEGKVEVWTHAWIPASAAEAEASVAVAEKVGAKEILYWEADYIDDPGHGADVKNAMNLRSERTEIRNLRK